jgi:hypothetical protein
MRKYPTLRMDDITLRWTEAPMIAYEGAPLFFDDNEDVEWGRKLFMKTG